MLNKLEQIAPEMDHVFTIKDLEVLLNDRAGATFYRKVKELTKSGELIKIMRGIYVTPSATLVDVCCRIYPESYVSTGTVLADRKLIGSVPARRVQAVKVGKSRTFRSTIGTIEFLGISPNLYFGFERKNNANWATPEKAFLDVCYFSYKGRSFSFDPLSDIFLEDLNWKTIDQYLRKFDTKFVSYFKQRWFNDNE